MVSDPECRDFGVEWPGASLLEMKSELCKTQTLDVHDPSLDGALTKPDHCHRNRSIGLRKHYNQRLIANHVVWDGRVPSGSNAVSSVVILSGAFSPFPHSMFESFHFSLPIRIAEKTVDDPLPPSSTCEGLLRRSFGVTAIHDLGSDGRWAKKVTVADSQAR